jgi:hypothetical protein
MTIPSESGKGSHRGKVDGLQSKLFLFTFEDDVSINNHRNLITIECLLELIHNLAAKTVAL